MRSIAVTISLLLAGCSTLNVFSGPNDFCRQLHSDYRSDFDEAIARELRHEPPNGALTKPYSPELWNKYWNDRIFYMWEIGPKSCNGTYRGPSGQEMLRYAIEKRRKSSLPEIDLDARNSGKSP